MSICSTRSHAQIPTDLNAPVVVNVEDDDSHRNTADAPADGRAGVWDVLLQLLRALSVVCGEITPDTPRLTHPLARSPHPIAGGCQSWCYSSSQPPCLHMPRAMGKARRGCRLTPGSGGSSQRRCTFHSSPSWYSWAWASSNDWGSIGKAARQSSQAACRIHIQPYVSNSRCLTSTLWLGA